MDLSRRNAGGIALLAVLLSGIGPAPARAEEAPAAAPYFRATPVAAQDDKPRSGSAQEIDVTNVTLEDLAAVEVTSVSKKAQKLSDAAAAIYVISREDIHRSGATSIPEALRMVPGIEVARINGNMWAITARGFNSRYANKLLVLMDGRSVYTPVDGGVYWEVQDAMMDDIDRIEVIRGPGAALWGANAVNGVINIITRQAKDTQGALAYIGAGNVDRGAAGLRYGGKAGDDTYYRGYMKMENRRGFVDAAGNRTGDDWQSGRGGFRVDRRGGGGDLFTLQGDWYQSRQGESFTLPTFTAPYSQTVASRAAMRGDNLLARWSRVLSATSGFTLQAYYDQTRRSDVSDDEAHNILDVDFQHRFALGERHDIVWGLGYRSIRDEIVGTPTYQLSQRKRNDTLVSGFVQDEIRLIPESLRLIAGSKFEHNGYSGFEAQPTLRMIWTPTITQSFWTSLSRAVHTPQRINADIRFNSAVFPSGPSAFAPLTELAVIGSPQVKSEELTAFELGYRFNPGPKLALDATAFFNRYRRLTGVDYGPVFFEPQPSPPHLVLPLYFQNNEAGSTRGVELALEWVPLNWWRWHVSYSTLFPKVWLNAGSTVTSVDPNLADGASPRRQLYARSSMNLDRRVNLDLWLKYVDRLPGFDVPAYTSFNGRLAWHMDGNVEIALAGYNLLDGRHPEFRTDWGASTATEVPRTVYVQATFRY